MAIVRHCFPECDLCGKVEPDLWAYNNKLALANALKHHWYIVDGKLCCSECADKRNRNDVNDYLRSKGYAVSRSPR